MAKPKGTTHVLRSVVSPALGLSLGVLAAAAAGCGNGGTPITSESAAAPGTTAAAAAAATTSSAAPATTVAAADPTATTTAAAAPTATATSTAAVSSTARVVATGAKEPIRPPGVTVYPKPGPPPPVPVPGTTTKVYPTPGPPPHKVGIMVAPPGLAPSGATIPPSQERPTRAARRATDPDSRLLRSRSRGLV